MRRCWALALLPICGCIGGGSGPAIQSAKEFLPEALFAEEAVLGYGGTEVPVKMRSEVEGNRVTFTLIAHGQPFEKETYESTSEAFSFAGIDDQFSPVIPLLKFPMRIGDKWEWTGALRSGAVDHKAKATVTSTRERLFYKGYGDLDTVRADVRLLLDSGTSTPAERKLSFWFVRGKGIVKREIGTATMREPAAKEDVAPSK